jgi:Uma2 family endonuclease
MSKEVKTMATAVHPVPELLTLEQYLQTSYRPDRDFVDGVTEERNVGESEHSDFQSELIYWFRVHRQEWNIRVNGELRTRIAERRYRVPDVCVRYLSAPREKVLITPPLIAIEVMSADDRLPRVIDRLKDFLTMCVPNVWLLDPIERVAYSYTQDGLKLVETGRIDLPGSPIYLDLQAIFSALD